MNANASTCILDGNMGMIRLMKEVPKTLKLLKLMLMIRLIHNSTNISIHSYYLAMIFKYYETNILKD